MRRVKGAGSMSATHSSRPIATARGRRGQSHIGDLAGKSVITIGFIGLSVVRVFETEGGVI